MWHSHITRVTLWPTSKSIYAIYQICPIYPKYPNMVQYIIWQILRANIPYGPHPFYAVHLGISNGRLYIQLGRSTRVFREYKFPTPITIRLLHSLKIFNKGLILPPPLNFYIHWRSSKRGFNSPTPVKLLHSLKIFNKGLILPPTVNFYIHWRSSIRV